MEDRNFRKVEDRKLHQLIPTYVQNSNLSNRSLSRHKIRHVTTADRAPPHRATMEAAAPPAPAAAKMAGAARPTPSDISVASNRQCCSVITASMRFKRVNKASPREPPTVQAARWPLRRVYGPGGGVDPPPRRGPTGDGRRRVWERSAGSAARGGRRWGGEAGAPPRRLWFWSCE